MSSLSKSCVNPDALVFSVRAHVFALRIADAAEPLVLKCREERDQPQQSHRQDEHRQPESTPHLGRV